MAEIIGYNERTNTYTVKLTTIWKGSKRGRRWRARVNALHASGLFNTSVDAIKEMPADKVERLTRIEKEGLMDEGISTKTWVIKVTVRQ